MGERVSQSFQISGRLNSQIAMARLKPGQYFGEIALLQGGARIATVIADPDHEHTEVMTLDKEAFLQLMELSPEAMAEAHRVADERLSDTETKRS